MANRQSTSNQTDHYVQQCGYSLHPEFHQFVETALAPATGLKTNEFWEVIVTTLKSAKSTDKPLPADVSANEACTTFNAINSSWGSLYDALYSENVIPHTAGLKPGNGHNKARRDRVIRCSKDFLDRTFPLKEGSHRDAVSYMVYFQNLLVILADGSTTGLMKPRQFKGKNGPTNEPESILLKHSGMHAEIAFDRHGTVGEYDLANIDDIQLEAAYQTLLDFTADSVSEKCDSYRNWIRMVEADQSDKTFTACDGDFLMLDHNSWAVQLSDQSDKCELMVDEQGERVSSTTIDAIIVALIHANSHRKGAHLNMYVSDTDALVNQYLFTELRKLLDLSRTPEQPLSIDCTKQPASIKVHTGPADTLPHANSASSTGHVTNPSLAVLGAMESHGYDVNQAMID